MKKWNNITVELPGIKLDPLLEYFSEVKNIYSISIKDKLSVKDSKWFDNPDELVPLNGDTHRIDFLVEHDYMPKKLLDLIKIFLKLDKTPLYYEKFFHDRDWVQHTQNQFKEIIISKKFRIIPPWHNKSKFIGQTIIINPGNGFGTGTHSTTFLCLKWIEKNINYFDNVLDYGSGSGILSIAAKLYGANSVEGVELDKRAIKNSKENSLLNKVSISYHEEQLFKSRRKYNLVISNILQPTLIKLSSTFKKLASDKILLSGILKGQTEMLINSYDWIKLKKIDEMDDWTLLLGEL